MSSQNPLTATPAPALDWSRPESPASTDFDDIYFSVDNGLEETRTVFLGGCGLPEGWQNRSRFIVGELGFGSGLNFLATWQMWDQTKPKDGHLHFISIEKMPFTADHLTRALSAWPELAKYAKQLIQVWPGRVKGFHRLEFGDVTLTLIHDDITPALEALDAHVDAWFLDGFSPAKNPDMWSPEVMRKLAKLSAPKARFGTFTVAGSVRQALTDAGFIVEKKEGFGRKRHRLEGRYDRKGIDLTRPTPRPIIIGGGIGGASVACAFLKRGITPLIIEADPDLARAASGNPAALVKPRLDLQDRPESRFFLSSYLYALQFYAQHGLILSTGMTHIPKSDAEAERLDKIVAQASLPDRHLSKDPLTPNYLYSEALTIDPRATLSKLAKGADHLAGRVANIVKSPQGWKVLDAQGRTLGEGTHVVVAAGADIQTLPPFANWDVRYTRGQLSWAEPDNHVTKTLTYGGYASALKDRLLLGATHHHIHDPQNPVHYLAHDADDIVNQSEYLKYTGQLAKGSSRPSRSSVRVTTYHTLPIIDEAEPGLWGLTGLGSRGFVFAPLLAETIAADICGNPSPISKNTRERFAAPSRRSSQLSD